MKAFLILLSIVVVLSCKQAEQPSGSYAAFTGATIIDGRGGEPVTNAVLLVQNGRVVEVGREDAVAIPTGASVTNLSGKFVIPGIINAHGHVGNTKGIEGGHYSRANVIDNLEIYARYGITTVVSLGEDQAEAVPLRHVNDSVPKGRARLFIAGDVISGSTPEEALEMVDSNHRMGVDFMKIRVDDNLGTGQKMSEEVYRAVIDRSHALGYRIASHMYYLDDAQKLLDAGSDLIAHSVRDVPVDQAFIDLIRQKGVGYCPTLTREVSAYVYESTPLFFADPFFLREYDSATVAPLNDPARQRQVRDSRNAQMYKQQLPQATENLKTLFDAGVPIIFGTDSGVPTRFMGYFEHVEMQMMAEAGLSPMEIIVSATRDAAEYMGLQDLGTLTEGHWADFVVLDADPLQDIVNTREISAVYIGGEGVN